ncbi:hypothetical protein [Paenibacillus sp. Mc5Re-14]|uniref:hypothetical protein n=1 Tax=Paenibacillus sp. Mc5Re-14 TaxID=1030529 RepID=UPI000ACAAD14|nr:hypothetical protein [Paenibacillus sp. Mc5Re-14]
MLFTDKLKDWYGEFTDYAKLKMTEDTAIFLVETKDNFEIARIFHVGNSKEISIDLKVVKGDTFSMMNDLASFLLKNKYDYIGGK